MIPQLDLFNIQKTEEPDPVLSEESQQLSGNGTWNKFLQLSDFDIIREVPTHPYYRYRYFIVQNRGCNPHIRRVER